MASAGDGDNVQQAVPLFAVNDMAESVRFYVDGLGFVMTEKWVDEGRIRWCWLNREKVAVMLQEIAREGRHAWKPDGTLGVGVSLNFICRDAIALYHEFRSRALAAGTPFVGNGMWVTSITDPDGYALHFESKTDVPEGSVYEHPG